MDEKHEEKRTWIPKTPFKLTPAKHRSLYALYTDENYQSKGADHSTPSTPNLTNTVDKDKGLDDQNYQVDVSCSNESKTLVEENQESELGFKTPQKRPRKKKHRPKVVIDCKPKGKLKNTSTTMPASSEKINTPKRKYVRRKNVGLGTETETLKEGINQSDLGSEVNTTPKRKYVRKNNARSEAKTPNEGRNQSALGSEVKTMTKRKYMIRANEATMTPPEEGVSGTSSPRCKRSLKSYFDNPISGEKSTSNEISAILKSEEKMKKEFEDLLIKEVKTTVDFSPPMELDDQLNNKSMADKEYYNIVENFLDPQTQKERDAIKPQNTSIYGSMLTQETYWSGKKRTKQTHKSTNYPHSSLLCCTSLGFRQHTMFKRIPSVDVIIKQFKHLDISTKKNARTSRKKNPYRYSENNALAVYQRDRSMIPYVGTSNRSKIRGPRPKVDLDEETLRVWTLLLENIDSQGIDSTDEEKRRYWENDRQVLGGRVESFVAKMRLVLGDRSFRPWKGSVLDSVIGVFLTQHVSDHLSSSAFMSMAERFPVKGRSDHASSSEGMCKTMDSVDWETVRCTEVGDIAKTIKKRGMNNRLAERIKDFLNRLMIERGSLDLEWLKDIPPDKAKEYLLSVRGLGLKSTECVRLLTLHHMAFPVDVNVGRIAVRLGWVPLQPLPESLQLHLLEMYPVIDSIQKHLWPRLCKLDQRKLYELHYHMITFGKVFCTSSAPNCKACPLQRECSHFASAYVSARPALPSPQDKSIVTAPAPESTENSGPKSLLSFSQLKPIIEEPTTDTEKEETVTEPLWTQFVADDMEDMLKDNDDEILTIDLNRKSLIQNLPSILRGIGLQDNEYSNDLVVLSPEAAAIPRPKLKNINRLRTEHQVYLLPDSHQLLKGLEQREEHDPSPYLLAIWAPGETINSIQPPERKCGSEGPSQLCYDDTCYSCNSTREAASHTVRGTILIPCLTAMRGSFPLNGTYFQVNEVFADHETSLNPIDIPRDWLWNLRRSTVYFGTSISIIFKSMERLEIDKCFQRGFICLRGFDRQTRGPRPLIARLHFPASKMANNNEGAGIRAGTKRHELTAAS